MVKKLMKYEFAAYSKTMLPMLIILFGVSLLTRFIQLFEANTSAYKIVFTSSIVALVISMIVCLVMTVFVAISRYYKNLFTLEGYLSFTLPVTTTQHIFNKLIVAVIFTLISIVSVILSGMIAMQFSVLKEVIKAGNYLLVRLFHTFSTTHLIFYIVESIIGFLVIMSTNYLLYYLCMTVGQLAKKNRVLLSFGVYFGYYFVTQILGTIFIVVFSAFANEITTAISNFFAAHTYAAIHITICSATVFTAILGAVYFFVSHYIIRKKLNLE